MHGAFAAVFTVHLLVSSLRLHLLPLLLLITGS
jgi:hypothetical protein